MQYAVCSMQYAVCSMQYAVCSMQYAVCSMQYAEMSLHCLLLTAYCLLPTVFIVSVNGNGRDGRTRAALNFQRLNDERELVNLFRREFIEL